MELYVKETLEAYHLNPAISASKIKAALRSPAHYMAATLAPPESNSTPAKRLGTLIHSAMLEPKRFIETFIVAPKCDRRTVAGKAEYSAFEEKLAANPSLISITDDQCDVVCGIARAMVDHPLVSSLLRDGMAEHSFYFTDPGTGLPCKVRPDYFRDDGIVVDVKSTLDGGYRAFQRQMDGLEYPLQAAFQMHGLQTVFGKPMREYIWLAAEKTEPYSPALYRADEAVLDFGTQEFRKGLQIIKQCRERETWPGYQFDLDVGKFRIQDMTLPPWRFTADMVL